MTPETERLARGMLRIWLVFAVAWTSYVLWQAIAKEKPRVESAHREAQAFLHKTWNVGTPVYVKSPLGGTKRFEFIEVWHFNGLPMNDGELPRDIPTEVATCFETLPKDGPVYVDTVQGKNILGFRGPVRAVVIADEELAKNALGSGYRLSVELLPIPQEAAHCAWSFYDKQWHGLQDEQKGMWRSFWLERVKRVLWPLLASAAGLALLIWLIEGFRTRKPASS